VVVDVKFKTRGNKELEKKLNEMPFGYKRVGLEAFADYVVGDENHGLKWYPAPAGQKYERTYNLRNAWSVQDSQNGYRPVITNAMPYAIYVPGRWKKYNWREWKDVIASNFKGAIRHAQAAVNAWIRSKFK